MRGPHVSQAPARVNPMTRHGVDELRQQLRRASALILEHGERLHGAVQVAREINRDIATIISARRIFGDAAALRLLAELEEILLTPDVPESGN